MAFSTGESPEEIGKPDKPVNVRRRQIDQITLILV